MPIGIATRRGMVIVAGRISFEDISNCLRENYYTIWRDFIVRVSRNFLEISIELFDLQFPLYISSRLKKKKKNRTISNQISTISIKKKAKQFWRIEALFHKFPKNPHFD